ncbi:phage tail tip lysozyme [Lutispora sp.]|uniref:phage tail tip lysozyme n=1 Tax=Lutispora sp. TaxID=2828727 RepID=UPI0035677094
MTDEQQKANAQYIYDYLIDEGWSKNAIAGLLGNIQQESQLNPGVWQDLNNTKLGYGQVQWDDTTKFLDWAELNVNNANGMAQNDPKQLMDLQLEFLIWSSQTSTPSDCRQWFATTNYDSPYKMTYDEYIVSTSVGISWIT